MSLFSVSLFSRPQFAYIHYIPVFRFYLDALFHTLSHFNALFSHKLFPKYILHPWVPWPFTELRIRLIVALLKILELELLCDSAYRNLSSGLPLSDLRVALNIETQAFVRLCISELKILFHFINRSFCLDFLYWCLDAGTHEAQRTDTWKPVSDQRRDSTLNKLLHSLCHSFKRLNKRELLHCLPRLDFVCCVPKILVLVNYRL